MSAPTCEKCGSSNTVDCLTNRGVSGWDFQCQDCGWCFSVAVRVSPEGTE